MNIYLVSKTHQIICRWFQVDYIIAVNEMMKTGKEIVRHLLNTFHSDPGCLKDRDSRQVIKAHLGR